MGRLIAEISYLGVRTGQAVTQTNVQKQHCCKLRELYAVSLMLCVQAVLGLQMISTPNCELSVRRVKMTGGCCRTSTLCHWSECNNCLGTGQAEVKNMSFPSREENAF